MNTIKLIDDISKTSGASVAALLISLATTPLLTRLYNPDAYGEFALLNNAAMFLSTSLLLALPSALTLESTVSARLRLLQAISAMLFAGTLIVSLIIVALVVLAWLEPYWLLLPVLLAASLGQRLLSGERTAAADFESQSLGRVAHPVLSRAAAIFTALLVSGSGWLLVLSEALGYVAQVVVMGRTRLKTHVAMVWAARRKLPQRMVAGISRHRDHVLYLNLTNIGAAGTLFLQSALIAWLFSVETAGLYTLAIAMTSMPVRLLAFATAPVFYREFLRKSQDSTGALGLFLLLVIGGFAAVGAGPYLLLWGYGEAIFELVFGQGWKPAGQLASIFALAFLLELMYVPVASVYRIKGRLRWQFVQEQLGNVSLLIVLFIGATNLDLADTMAGIALVMMISRVFYLGSAVYCAAAAPGEAVRSVT